MAKAKLIYWWFFIQVISHVANIISLSWSSYLHFAYFVHQKQVFVGIDHLWLIATNVVKHLQN